jgi:hypothetical protein
VRLFDECDFSPRPYPVPIDSSRALEIGKAAEHLVCADILLHGHKAFLSDQGMPYDVIIDHKQKLFRVQVRSTLLVKAHPQRKDYSPYYMFNVRRAGSAGRRSFGNDEFDLLALVALDIRAIAYIPIDDRVLQYILLRPPGVLAQKGKSSSRRCMDQYPLDMAIEEMLRAS